MSDYPKIAQLKTVAAFRARLQELGLDLPVDDAILTAAQGSPLAASLPSQPSRNASCDAQAESPQDQWYFVVGHST